MARQNLSAAGARMGDPLIRQFVVVVGKGGCGRTSVAAAVALHCALSGQKTLLCTQAARSPFSEAANLSPGTISVVTPLLSVLRSSPKDAREEYGLLVLKSRTLHRMVFANRHVNQFLDAVPGLAEWAILGKATWHALQTTDPAKHFDTVILDAPATGHGLDMLKLPAAIAASVPIGRIRDEALERMEMLCDPLRCAVIPVSLLEELPVSETIELVDALRRSGFPIPFIVANRVMDEVMTSKDGGAPPNLSVCFSSESTPPWALAVAVHEAAVRRQRALLKELRHTTKLLVRSLPFIEIALDTASAPVMMQSFLTGEKTHDDGSAMQ